MENSVSMLGKLGEGSYSCTTPRQQAQRRGFWPSIHGSWRGGEGRRGRRGIELRDEGGEESGGHEGGEKMEGGAGAVVAINVR